MKSIPVFLVLSFFTATGFSQSKNLKGLSFQLSGGMNNHSYTRNYTGWFFRAGIDQQITGGFGLGIAYTHTAFNNFPRPFHVYSFQPGTEQSLLQQWTGISEKEWASAEKGYYKVITGDILSLQASYRFRAGNRVTIIPRCGISYISSAHHTTGVFEAFFVNDRLTTGRIGYDFRNSKLAGWSFGLAMHYRLSDRLDLQLIGEDNRDINGEGFHYYEAKLLGAGLQYRLSRE